MSPLIAYYRVSTQKQGRSGLGLEGQRAAVKAFAAAEGFEIIAEFTEIETGKGSDALTKRPKLLAALAHAKRDGASVIVAGAYGHSRFRELILGGMTQHLITQTARCVLLSH